MNPFKDLYDKVVEVINGKGETLTKEASSLSGVSALEVAEMCKQASESCEDDSETKEKNETSSEEKEDIKESKETNDGSKKGEEKSPEETHEDDSPVAEEGEKTASDRLYELIVKTASSRCCRGLEKTASVNDRNLFLAEVENVAYSYGLQIIRGKNGN